MIFSISELLEDILFNIKYYFVFAASTLNPFLYGYNNTMMQKAFKLTFPCFFKKQASPTQSLQAQISALHSLLGPNSLSSPAQLSFAKVVSRKHA